MKLGSISIGGVDYAVHRYNTIEVDGYVCRGTCETRGCVINLVAGMSKSLFVNTFIHELIHATLSVLSQPVVCKDTGERAFEEESICDAVAAGLGQNLREIEKLWKAYRSTAE